MRVLAQLHLAEVTHEDSHKEIFQDFSPASSMFVHFWYMDVRSVGVRTLSMRILSTRESNTRSVCSFSSSSWQRILLSMKEANICVSRKRDRKGR